MSTQRDEIRYTIKQASQLSGLPASTLRYYESIGIIDSVARDKSSGHRTYTQDDINVIDAIACLSATGMPLDDMRLYLANRQKGTGTADAQLRLLKAQARRLKDEQSFIKLRRDYVALKINYWQAVKMGDHAQIERLVEQSRTLATALKFPKLR